MSIESIESWLEALIANRRSQVELLAPSRGATFYLWFGFQDQALCFNVISDADRSLPFGCTTRPVASPGNIIAAFLADPWSDDPALTPYILKSEVEWAAVETDPKAYLLDVFVVRFRSDGTTRSDTEEQHGQNHP